MKQHSGTSLWRYLKPTVDALLVFLSFTVAYWLRYDLQWFRQVEPAFFVPFRVYLPSVISMSVLLVGVYWLEGAYRNKRGRPFFDEFYIVFRGTLIGIATMIVVVFLATPSYYSRLIFGYTGVITLFTVGTARAIEGAVMAWRHRRGLGVNRVLIVGADEVARSIMRAVVARPELGYQVVGFVDDDPTRSQTDIGRYPALGTTDRLTELITEHDVNEVIITLPWDSHRKILHLMRQCERRAVRVRIVPDLFQMALSRVVVDHLDGVPLLGIREPALSEWQMVLKRATDVIISLLGLVLLSPVLLIIAVALKLDSPGPVIFKQVRVGRGGQQFTCFKFRSMCIDAEARLHELQDKNESTGPLFKMRNDPRLTRVGRLLRRTSMDELPQLWNILRGEMSLIGPRPAIPTEVEQYEAWHLRRLDASPGLTGLWQVSGRSNLTFDEMVLLDIYYIENWSPILDLQIMLKTIPTVILGAGAY
ncbi:MAG TPA: undecaprenyl-phosphate glucose phosphotransferase [Chloroflexi bacterium]|jgi:exopolysaccharide biosynthesis polyprenyl glycosylphosphotransferase|nr:undecaprenyl-phosphate glucose phosphotransferase [Chloroflexota bacterium]